MARSLTTKPASRSRKGRLGSPTAKDIRTYRSALGYLNARVNHEQMPNVTYSSNYFNLTRMNRLLGLIGNPHKGLRCVHVAGTKGKGSTAVMLSSMLMSCGYKVGLYTSPHMVDIRERIRIDGEMVRESELTKLIITIAKAATKLKQNEPTYFEILTAAAFLYFAEREVDIAIIETGLGGRLDSTNVIKPEVCAITSISRDHMSVLGESLPEIALEKAGIFKAGVPIVSAPQPPAVKAVLQKAAEHTNSRLQFTGEDIHFSYRFESSRTMGPHTRICVTTPVARFEHLHVPLLGDHQAVNCSVALGCMSALKERGFDIDEQKVVEGLSKVTLSGRMEFVSETPRVMVDGAHNAASVEALMRAIGQNIPYDSMVVIFGCKSEKDISGMLRHLQLGADKLIFTEAGPVRSADPQDLLAAYTEMCGKMAQVAPKLQEALDIAYRAVGSEDLICICGSFQLVGRAKRLFSARNN